MLTIRNEYNKYNTKTFRIPIEINDTLRDLAKAHNTSVNKVVIQCLEFALSSMDEEGTLRNTEYEENTKSADLFSRQ